MTYGTLLPNLLQRLGGVGAGWVLSRYTVLELGERDIIRWYAKEYEWEHQLEPEDTLERERILEQKKFEAEQNRLYNQEISG